MDNTNAVKMSSAEFGELCNQAVRKVLSCWGDTQLEDHDGWYYIEGRHKWSPLYCDWKDSKYEIISALTKCGALSIRVTSCKWNYVEVYFSKPKRIKKS